MHTLGLPPSVIAPPDVCIVASWYDVGLHIHRPVPRLTPAAPTELYTQPVAGLNIHLVNEAWGDLHGWSKGSLQSAERALRAAGAPQPTRLNARLYKSVIEQFNKGS